MTWLLQHEAQGDTIYWPGYGGCMPGYRWVRVAVYR